MSYLNFGKKNILLTDFEEIINSYNDGYVFVRSERGLMEKVRSVRVNLEKFELSSENRRVLKKFDHEIELNDIPFEKYSWEIIKKAKDFYDNKFGKDTFSANKIKEIFTTANNNFNSVLTFKKHENTDGYCICYSLNGNIAHYAYPFYDLSLLNTSFGMFMMTLSIVFFKNKGYKYVYLGSYHDRKSFYKFQFKGIEWFDENINSWSDDIQRAKSLFTE